MREISENKENTLGKMKNSIENVLKHLDNVLGTPRNLSGVPEEYRSNKEENVFEPNTIYEIDGKLCETDDKGNIIKVDGHLLPGIKFEANGKNMKQMIKEELFPLKEYLIIIQRGNVIKMHKNMQGARIAYKGTMEVIYSLEF